MTNQYTQTFTLLLFLGWIINYSLIFSQKKTSATFSSVIGGENTSIQNKPWQVALSFTDNEDLSTSQFCSGAIIDPVWILTSASCIQGLDPRDLLITAGVSSLSNDIGVSSNVTQLIVHPSYQANAFENDLALIRLASPLDTTLNTVEVISIASAEAARLGLEAPGTIANISGWGWTDNNGTRPDSLQTVDVSLISLTTAQRGYDITLTNNMLAAGDSLNGGADACVGDNGGPLIKQDSSAESPILIGIASFGSGQGCGLAERPYLYTRISAFEDWISNISGLGQQDEPVLTQDIGIVLWSLEEEDSLVICANDTSRLAFSAELIIENAGEVPIDLLVFSYYLPTPDGNTTLIRIDSIALPTPLLNRASLRIDTLQFNISPRLSPSISVSISGPPDFEDMNPNNDSSNFTISQQEGFLVQVDILTDNFPSDNQWFIFADENLNEIVHFGNQGLPYETPNTLISESVCLPAGDYTFLIEDLTFDGIQPPGDFTLSALTDSQSYTLLENTENFFFESTASFSLPFSPNLAISLERILPQTDTIINCEDSVQFITQALNIGTLPIQSIHYTLFSNDTLLVEDSIETFVGRGQSLGISFPFIPPSSSSNLSFRLISTHISGAVELRDTSILPISFTLQAPSLLVPAFFQFQSDEFPSEISWNIKNERGKILDASLSFPIPNANFREEVCLTEGCYQFMIQDVAGDGLFNIPEPVARLLLADSTEIFRIQPDFGFRDSADFCLLAAPQDLIAFFNVPSNGVFLDWEDISNIEEGYVLERLTNDSSFNSLFILPPNTTSFIDSTAPLGVALSYQVKAFIGDQFSSRSNMAQIQIVSSLDSELNGSNWRVYPNPCSNIIHIESSLAHSSIQEIRLISPIGKLLVKREINALKKELLDISWLSPGQYILAIENAQTTHHMLILKE